MENLAKAMFWEKAGDNKVRCELCPHKCLISPGGVGACRVRKNINGELYSLVYGLVSSIAVDPIEKKPLYHQMFSPSQHGAATLNVRTVKTGRSPKQNHWRGFLGG